MSDDELQKYFAKGGAEALDPDILGKLNSIMRMHQLSAEDLFYKWESYCIKLNADASAITLEAVRNLEQDVRDSIDKTSRQQTQVKTEKRAGATPRARGGDVFGMFDGMLPNTPVGTGKRPNKQNVSGKRAYETPSMSRIKREGGEPMSSSPDFKSSPMQPPSSFHERPNAGDVVEVLGEQLAAPEPPICPFAESRIRLTARPDQKKPDYKPLSMKLSEASEVLDDRIDDFLHLIQEYHKLDPSEFGSAANQSTTAVVAVGRIASDSPEGKLNAASLILETSRRTGGGLRVPLNLGRQAFSFFPGQIVALKGINTSGNEFIVEKILEIPIMPYSATPRAKLDMYREKMRGDPDAMDSDSDPAPLNVIFAAGPFTADDNLDFDPLHTLCSQAADTYADALVLTGPFIDAEHPLIATGDFDLPEADQDTATMSTVFKHLFAPALNRLASANPSITILLIPSVRDVIDNHVSWPQDTAARKELGLPKAARFLPNPMTFSLNEMVVGCSSQDILWELRREELVSGAVAEPSLMSRLCKYLVEQRHYFPLFPPVDRASLPKTGTAEGVPPGAMLDVSYLKLGEIIQMPDVMVVPSLLPPFAKVVDSVVMINPGNLSKRRGAGTFARMALYPPPAGSGDGEELVRNEIFDRARVEIVRI